jgi:hypothetical protein
MNIDNFIIEGKKIIFETGKSIEFDFKIHKSIAINDKIIILLDSPDKGIYNQNIFAVAFDGNLIWQVEKSPDLDLIGYCPYTGLYREGSDIVGYNWCGFRITIDTETGKIMNILFTK